MSKRKLEATKANQARRAAAGKRSGRRLPPGHTPPRDRRRVGLLAGGAALVVVLVALGAYAAFGQGSSVSTKVDWSQLEGLQTGPAPWNSGSTLALEGRVSALGLPELTHQREIVHIHQHIDIYVDGKHMFMPGNMGIDLAGRFLSPLHVHTQYPGVLHDESPKNRPYTLGEAFGVWGVKLTKDCIGMYCAGNGKELRWWLNGTPQNGDPSALALASHQVIVLAYGTPAQMPKKIRSTFAWNGL
jgi:hypothetical protein